jgi:hypothetical protein
VANLIKLPLYFRFLALILSRAGAISRGFSTPWTMAADDTDIVEGTYDKNFRANWTGERGIVAKPIGVGVRRHRLTCIVPRGIKAPHWHSFLSYLRYSPQPSFCRCNKAV